MFQVEPEGPDPQAMRSELDRRIAALAADALKPGDALGGGDWAVLLGGCVLLPLFVVWLGWVLR